MYISTHSYEVSLQPLMSTLSHTTTPYQPRGGNPSLHIPPPPAPWRKTWMDSEAYLTRKYTKNKIAFSTKGCEIDINKVKEQRKSHIKCIQKGLYKKVNYYEVIGNIVLLWYTYSYSVCFYLWVTCLCKDIRIQGYSCNWLWY